jgi:predicted nucleotide-binding protein (sugar kinase/HSP70/actin superfamily)
MGPKACLILELDEHSAAAGVMTRLEAFQNVIHNTLPKPAPVKWLPRAAAGRGT